MLTISERGNLLINCVIKKMAPCVCAYVNECKCVHVWESVLVILEEDENIGVEMMRKSGVFLKGTLFSGSSAMLIECDSLIKGHDLVHTYQF